jgi:ABC-type phosphate/phosphonate transport system permease subunit
MKGNDKVLNLMRKLLIILVLTILIFGILTITTAKFESASDGNDTMGFPLTYFIGFGGKRFPYPPKPTETNYWKLLLDILFAAFIAILGLTIFINVKNTLKK